MARNVANVRAYPEGVTGAQPRARARATSGRCVYPEGVFGAQPRVAARFAALPWVYATPPPIFNPNGVAGKSRGACGTPGPHYAVAPRPQSKIQSAAGGLRPKIPRSFPHAR